MAKKATSKKSNTKNTENKAALKKLYNENKDYLRLLSKLEKPSKRNQLIDIGNKDNINAICQCIRNVLKGNIHLKDHEINKLRKYKNTLFTLAKKNTSLIKKKQALKQRGGFLPFLLPLAVDLIGGLLGKIAK